MPLNLKSTPYIYEQPRRYGRSRERSNDQPSTNALSTNNISRTTG